MSAWRSEWDAELVPVPDDSERAVEIPWAASAIGSCAGLWLDIGYAYAEPRFWEAIPNDGWRRRLRYGFGLDVAPAQHVNTLDMELVGDILDYDLSSLPRFNLITCVSTLEHLGCDNTNYLEGIARRKVRSACKRGSSPSSSKCSLDEEGCSCPFHSVRFKTTVGSCSTTRRWSGSL